MKNKHTKQILQSLQGGLYVYCSHSSEFVVNEFVQRACEKSAIRVRNEKRIEKIYEIEFEYEKWYDFFSEQGFIELDDFEPQDVVFDGSLYFILFKSHKNVKQLSLHTPDLSDCKVIKRVVSFIEDNLFKI